MFTRNFYNCFKAMIGGPSAPVVNVKNANGNALTTKHGYNPVGNGYFVDFGNSSQYSPYVARLIELGGNYAGVCFGNGTAQPTFEDYSISVISGLIGNAGVTVEDDENGARTVSANHTITNNNSSAVTISEVGLFAYNSGQTGVSSKILLERTLLETPVTIPAGGVGQVTYKIKMNFPT